jgi:hypothetical protein
MELTSDSASTSIFAGGWGPEGSPMVVRGASYADAGAKLSGSEVIVLFTYAKAFGG